MTTVDSNFNFLCGRPHGAGPPPPVHMRPTMGVDRRVDRGTNPPYFLELGGQSMLCPPLLFEAHLCLFLRLCVCNFCYNCYLAKTVNRSRAKSSLGLLWLIMSLCPYC